jgi:hypothetical protein
VTVPVSVTYVELNADDAAQRAEGSLWLTRDVCLVRFAGYATWVEVRARATPRPSRRRRRRRLG